MHISIRILANTALVAWASALCACTENPSSEGDPPDNPPIQLPPPQAALSPITGTKTDRFATHDACAQCHYGGPDTPLLHDASGNDISPVFAWQSSMMAFASRDPYYLAIFGEELLGHASEKDFVETTCTRCHAPAGSVEHEQTGGHLSYESLVSGDSNEANLARDGVTCTLCHQIQDIGLGKSDSFTGGFSVGWDRKIYGPHVGPKTDPMQFMVNYTPTAADHITKSELCATCHTVLIPIFSKGQKVGDFLEQAPFLEWQNSTFSPGSPCGSCHLPTKDGNMMDISTPIAKWPANLASRSPFGQHHLSGGNAYMLGILAENVEWTGANVPKQELEAAAIRAQAHLTEGPKLFIQSSTVEGNSLTVVVRVENHAGHKLPTGYPGRRAWLHFRAETAMGEVVFESGAHDASGSLVDRAGQRLDDAHTVMPHYDEISAETQVQVYEAIAEDAAGKPTHLPLASVGYLKDNRLLPIGWSDDNIWYGWIGPVGIGSDSSFSAGMDLVTYRVPNAGQIKKLTVEMLYQTVRPVELEVLAKVPHPAAVAFSKMASTRPPTPLVMAQATSDL